MRVRTIEWVNAGNSPIDWVNEARTITVDRLRQYAAVSAKVHDGDVMLHPRFAEVLKAERPEVWKEVFGDE